jgi:hypothetical protein
MTVIMPMSKEDVVVCLKRVSRHSLPQREETQLRARLDSWSQLRFEQKFSEKESKNCTIFP